MYGAIYKCKMCGCEFPYIAPGEKEMMAEIGEDTWEYTPFGSLFPENWISGKEKDPPRYIPHYCNGNNDDNVGAAELIGFKEMVAEE